MQTSAESLPPKDSERLKTRSQSMREKRVQALHASIETVQLRLVPEFFQRLRDFILDLLLVERTRQRRFRIRRRPFFVRFVPPVVKDDDLLFRPLLSAIIRVHGSAFKVQGAVRGSGSGFGSVFDRDRAEQSRGRRMARVRCRPREHEIFAARSDLADNVGTLRVAWRWRSIDQDVLAARSDLHTFLNEGTPVMAGGRLYTVTSLSQVAAIDPATGRTIWS